MSQATVTDIHLVPFETLCWPRPFTGHEPLVDDQPGIHETPAGGRVARCISCAAASVMKRWGVTIIRNSPCWSGTVHITICTAWDEQVDDLLQQVLDCSRSGNALLSALSSVI